MISPDYICSKSLVENKVFVKGNYIFANEVEFLATEYCKLGLDLYTAQDKVKDTVCNKYGQDYYDKSTEAITYIVENVYCNEERRELPFFDKERYSYDKTHGVMY